MPVYAVRDVETNDVRLVEANHPATAIKHVVTPRYTAALATAADGVDAGRAGRGIEQAGAEPEPQPQAVPEMLTGQAMTDANGDNWAERLGGAEE